jgi:hypothetical protein
MAMAMAMSQDRHRRRNSAWNTNLTAPKEPSSR